MATITPVIQDLPTPAIASYAYTDIADGTGIVAFYLTKVATAASTYEHKLVPSSAAYSESNGVTAATGSLDLDFDVVFNRPVIIEGTMYLEMPVALIASSGTVTIDVEATIIHYDGTTETTIGAMITSPSFSTTTTSSYVSQMRVLKWAFTSPQKFKAGDTLRVTIGDNVTGSGTKSIGHSPVGNQRIASGQEFEDLGTHRATLYVPMKLNV